MKNSKINIFAASMVLGSVLLSGQVMADKGDMSKERPDRQMIKVKAKDGSDIKVMIGVNGERKKYSFTADELKNMDNVAAKLNDLDQAHSTKVLKLLAELNKHDAKVVELKTMDITRDKSTSSVVMVKTGDTQGAIHIEVDVTGTNEKHSKRLLKSFFDNGRDGHKKMKKDGKRMKHMEKREKHMKKDGKKRDVTKMLKAMIKKSELTDEQVTELKALLDDKNS